MDARTTRSIASAIDRTIQKVGETEYQRLSKDLTLSERKTKIRLALRSLDLLQSGEQPDYQNDWVALFYVLWYQPKQINLAYGMIKRLLSVRGNRSLILGPSGRLRVIDFGCGALAMQFAVALAVTDAIIDGQAIDSINIHSSDTSRPMIDLGVRLWEQFVVESSAIPPLNKALSLVEVQCSTSPPDLFREEAAGYEYWVSAIHALYDDNAAAIKRVLGATQTLSPIAMLISTHQSKHYMLQQVRPAKFRNCMSGTDSIEAPIPGNAVQVSHWRRSLNSKTGLQHQYLDRNVAWQWPSEAWLIYNGLK